MFTSRSQPILLAFFLSLLGLLPPVLASSDSPRYFFSGDGKLKVKEGTKGLDRIEGRLKALLDYLDDHLSKGKGRIEVFSGYRSPSYNEGLRKKGKLAAKTSLHTEGMAVDFALEGIPAKKLWHFVRELNCCGVGFYNGGSVHLDTGPARFWDQDTSKVFTDISDDNKRIYVTTNYDIYHPGETVSFRIVRVTLFPFGLKREIHWMAGEKSWEKSRHFAQEDCMMIQDPKEAALTLKIPPKAGPKEKTLQLKLEFCNKPAEAMPDFVLSNPFMIVSQ